MHTHKHIHTHTQTHTHKYIYIYIYIYKTHTHTHKNCEGRERPGLRSWKSAIMPPFTREKERTLALPFLSSSASPQGRRSYAIEHFRWGKPVGRKQPKVKVYTSTSAEEDSAEVLPGKMRGQEPAGENKAAENAAMGLELAEEDQEKLPSEVHQKKDGKYKIKHFRWSRPPASRRHGGLTRSREAQPEAAAHAP